LKRSLAVTVFGQKISLKSDADESYVQQLVECVDGRMRELSNRSQKAGLQEVAMLAALQLADDLFREQRRRVDLRRKVRAQAQRLMEQLGGPTGTEMQDS
jgi:cell division protein ZapA